MNNNTSLYKNSRENIGLNNINFIFALILIIVSDDVLSFGTRFDSQFLYIVKIAIYIFFIIWLGYNIISSKVSKKAIFLSFIFLFFILLAALINFDFTGGYGYQIMILLVALQISIKSDLRILLFFFQKAIIFFSMISIIIFFTYEVYPYLFNIFPTFVGENGVSLKNLFITTIYTDRDSNRNPGIFREPGVFAIYIIIAVIINIYFFEKINKTNLFILFMALLTTYSTSGYIVSLLIILCNLNYKTKKLSLAGLLLVSSTILVLIFVSSIPEVQQVIVSKFESNSDNYGSTVSRLASISVPFNISLINPVIGVGLNNFSKFFSDYSAQLFGVALASDGHSSNTFMALIATYGWIFGILILFLLLNFSKIIASGKFKKYIVFLAFLLLFSSQDMRYSITFWTFLLIGIKSKV